MGTFVFKWPHPASEVFVTGTFDNWQKTERLDRTGDGFAKEVALPSAADKIYYKFVVDGNWVTDHTAPQEKDQSGNLNNVLTTDRIASHTPATAGIMSGVTPSSSTAKLAQNVPKDNGAVRDLPGAFPETPATEPEAFSVNPIPASEGAGNPVRLAPGEAVPPPSQFTSNTISSTVHDDEELKAADAAKGPPFGVHPIPATAGAGNPIKLAAGKPVPPASQITGNTVNSTVRTDKASYENSGGIGNAPVLPPVVTPQVERDAKGTGILDMPSTSRNLIPESSLPMGQGGAGTYDASPTIQSVGPTSTTAGLAAGVPLEKDTKKKNKKKKGKKSSSAAPEIVQESQAKADFPPEASASPEEVREKADVEKELLAEIPLAPVTSDGSTAAKSIGLEAAAVIGGAAATVGGAAVAAAAVAKEKISESISHAPSAAEVTKSLPSTAGIKESLPSTAGLTQALPESVVKSISSMNETAKRQSVAGGGGAEAVSPAAPSVVSPPALSHEVSADAPAVVRASISEAHESPEAAAYVEPIVEKHEVEAELLETVPRDLSKGDPAPTVAPVAPVVPAKVAPEAAAASPEVSPGASPNAELPQEAELVPSKEAVPRFDSRDVSPTTVLGEHTQTAPEVTTGLATTTAPKASVAEAAAPAVTTGLATTTAPKTSVAEAAAPAVTTGLATTTAPKASVAPAPVEKEAAAAVPAAGLERPSEAGSSAGGVSPAESGAAAKAKKRRSFFGKLKDKLKDL